MKITDYQFVRTKGKTHKRRSHIPKLEETQEESFSSPPSYYANHKLFSAVSGIKREDLSILLRSKIK